MKTIINYQEVADAEGEEAIRPGLSEREIEALQFIQNSANEPMPLNQADLRTFYRNKISILATAYNKLMDEIYVLFDESLKKNVYDMRDQNFVTAVAEEIGYQQGGKRIRRMQRNRTIRRRRN